MKLRILNHSKNSVLATHASVADTPTSRKRGLLDHAPHEFTPGNGLLFPECNSVHTVEMKFPIDVLFIDMLKRRVQKAVSNAEPTCHFNTLIPAVVCSVLELPAGVIQMTGTEAGDVIGIMSAGHSSQEELQGIAMFWPTGA